MLKTQLIILLVLFFSSSFAQKPLEYAFDLSVKSQKKESIEELTKEWFQAQNVKLSKTDKDTLWATGSVEFVNTVVYQQSKTYNRVYREQSNGKIAYRIKIYLIDDQMRVQLSQFKHQPKMRFDNLNFGIITDCPNAPAQITSMTDEVYSQEVWLLLKKTVNDYSTQIKNNSVRIASN